MERFLIWLSGADTQILSKCSRMPHSERRKFAGYGTTVLIPATLGLFSMGYAVSTFTKSSSVYITAGVLWFFIVLAIDRFLVSTLYKSSVNSNRGFWLAFTFRLLFAGFVGVAVSHPMVLFLFEGGIKQKLADVRRSETDVRLQRIEQLKHDAQQGPDAEELKKKTEYRSCLERVLEAEQAGSNGEVHDKDGRSCGYSSGEVGCGPRCQNVKERLKILDKEIAALDSTIQQQVADVGKATHDDVADVQRQYDVESADYLRRIRGLAALERDEPHVWFARTFLMAFFVFIDTLLILLKATTPMGEYERIRDSLLYESKVTEEARMAVTGAWAQTGFRGVAEAEQNSEAKKNEILTIVKVTNKFFGEWEQERDRFDHQINAMADNIQKVRDDEAKKIYSARLGDMRDAFNIAWGKAMQRFQEYLRTL